MSLATTIESAVNSAFAAVDDLAKDAVLYKNNITGFDFATGQVTTSGASQITIKVIPYQTENNEDNSYFTENFPSSTTSAIINDDIDITFYEEIEIDSKRYRIEGYEKYPGIYVLALKGD